MTIAETFDDHWSEQPGPLDTPCHIWQRSVDGRGYGKLWVNGKLIAAHRYSYERRYNTRCGGYCLHMCDRPACVNPEHLFIGTLSENTKDMVAKGRHRRKDTYTRGSSHFNSVLNESAVRDIKKCHRAHSKTNGTTALAKKYSVSVSCINNIVRGRSWVHV